MNATREQQQMLAELGYEAIWAQDVQDGDDIAVCGWDKDVDFMRVCNVRRSAPQYEHDGGFGFGRVLNPNDPHYVFSWIGKREDGSQTHSNYGMGYPLWRRKREDAS